MPPKRSLVRYYPQAARGCAQLSWDFGIGWHFHPSSNLARLALQVIFEEIVRRIRMQLDDGISWLRSTIISWWVGRCLNA